jgi:hypothetical protein
MEGRNNTALGAYSLYSNIGTRDFFFPIGSFNTAIGTSSLYANTNGTENTAVGSDALGSNTTGNSNTAIGFQGLTNNKTGDNNTAFGVGALFSNTKGFQNVANGNYAGSNVTDGDDNVFIGYNANCGTGGHLYNSIALGNDALVTTNNTVRIGNSSVISIGGYVNWSNISDGRVKKNIKQNVPGLEFINKLQPVTYNLDLDAADKILKKSALKNKDGKIIQPSQAELNARKEKEQIVYTGFVAQDVEKSAKELNYDFSGVDKPGNANSLYGLRYADFVVPIVKGMQELSSENDSLKSEITNLKSEIDEIKGMIISNQSSSINKQTTIISSASLSQNIPNPFANSTTISYSISQHFSSAKIIITDKKGNVLKQISLSANKNSVNIDAATLSSGAYQYSLYVDGRLIASKQMVLAK